MKTDKIQREAIRRGITRYGENKRSFADDLLDDIDTLESRLKWAEDLLEQAKEFDAFTPNKIRSAWFSDLAKGFPGGVE